MLDDGAVEQLASDLLRARDAAGTVLLPGPGGPLDLEAGYRVGLALHGRLVARGYRPVGRKVGLTNRAVWDQFRATGPVWAHVYAQTVRHQDAAPRPLPLSGMVAPRLEPEVVLKLARPVPPGDVPVAELAACVEWAALGFEVVDSHVPGWRVSAAEAVADFGVHAALVVGAPWRVGASDPRAVAAALEEVRVTLHRGEGVFAEGVGRNALGSPLLALGFLARVVASQPWATPLAAGEIVATGTLTPPPDLRPGERWRVAASGAPLAALEFEAGPH